MEKKKVEPKFDSYTPLTVTRAKIFNMHKENGKWKKPRVLGPQHQRNKSKWCDFHDCHGHDTEECYQLKDVSLSEDDPERITRIESGLSSDLRVNLIQLLRDNKDIFAFSVTEMPGVSPKLITHS